MSDIDLLNNSIAGEYFGVAAYDAAIGSGLLDDATTAVAAAFRDHHRQHAIRLAELVTERGGTPAEPLADEEYGAKFPALNDAGDVVAYAIELESGAASADIASIGKFEDVACAVVIAQIAAVETMHWSALLAATGQNPAPVAFVPLPA